MAKKNSPSLSLAPVLSVDCVREGEFTTRMQSHGGRSFGGESLACAALAAAHTCKERELHSLHAYFLRPVPAETPLELEVERLKDGRRLAHRRAQIRQGERLLCEVTASFASAQGGVGYQDGGPPPDTPGPEALPSEEEVATAEGWTDWAEEPVEWRFIGKPWKPAPPGESPSWAAWVRLRTPLPDDPRLHMAALVYLSDFLSHWAVQRRFGDEFLWEGFSSLDHALWVHRTEQWDDWWLMTSESEVGHTGRGFTRREIYNRDGRAIASIGQQSLIGGPAPARSEPGKPGG